jgi:transposase
MHRIGEEVSEALDRVPAVLRVLRTIRPKYACRSCEGPIVRKLHGSPTALCLGFADGDARRAILPSVDWRNDPWRNADIER